MEKIVIGKVKRNISNYKNALQENEKNVIPKCPQQTQIDSLIKVSNEKSLEVKECLQNVVHKSNL